MAAVTICSNFGAQKNKVWHCFHCFPIYFPWSGGTGCIIFVIVQSFSHVQFFVIPWTASHQASLLSFTISWSLLKLVSIEWMIPSNRLNYFYPLLLLPHLSHFPASGSFPVSQLFTSGGQSIGVLASESVSVLPMNIQGWVPIGLTGLISLLSKGLLRVFSSTINSLVLSLLHILT